MTPDSVMMAGNSAGMLGLKSEIVDNVNVALTRSQMVAVSPQLAVPTNDRLRTVLAGAVRAQQALAAATGKAQAELSRQHPELTRLGQAHARRRFAQAFVDGEFRTVGEQVAAVVAEAAEAEVALSRGIDGAFAKLSAAEIASATSDANHFASGRATDEEIAQLHADVRNGDRFAALTGMLVGRRTPVGKSLHQLARQAFGRQLLESFGKSPDEVDVLRIAAGIVKLQHADVLQMLQFVAKDGEDPPLSPLQVAGRWNGTPFDELVAEGTRHNLFVDGTASIGADRNNDPQRIATGAAALVQLANEKSLEAARLRTNGGTRDHLGRTVQ